VDHDARGFLMILKSLVRPKIVGAAGSLITAARREHARSPEPGSTQVPGTLSKTLTSLKVTSSDSIPVNFEGPPIRERRAPVGPLMIVKQILNDRGPDPADPTVRRGVAAAIDAGAGGGLDHLGRVGALEGRLS
jgi:hypothetical protein